MLNKTSHILAAKLVKAMALNPELTAKKIAMACEVTPQAVNGWRTTGRIDKKQIPKLVGLTGYTADWWLDANPESPPETAPLVIARGGIARANILSDTIDAVPPTARVPVVGTAQLGDDGFWLEIDHPVGFGDGWVPYPSRDPNTYAVRCKGDSMRPRIKPGEFVVAEPNRATSPGDEVLVKDKRGRIMVKVLNFRRNNIIELGSINEEHRPITLEVTDVEYIHYVGGILKASMYYENMS